MALRKAGADAIFPPGTVIAEAAGKLVDALLKEHGHEPVADGRQPAISAGE